MDLRFRAAFLAIAAVFPPALPAVSAADCGCGGVGCTEDACAQPCVPACRGTWEEHKTKKPRYSMQCEYACARDRESWCPDASACSCSPPCGRIYVKKRIYKSEGKERCERVPKYGVTMVPAEPCDCARCSGVCWWDPLSVIHYLLHH